MELDLSRFDRFVADNQLEIEWGEEQGEYEGVADQSFVPTSDVVNWLRNPQNPPQKPGWIFIGRLLRSDQDAAVLENPEALGNVMQAVLCGFRPIWQKTQMMARPNG